MSTVCTYNNGNYLAIIPGVLVRWVYLQFRRVVTGRMPREQKRGGESRNVLNAIHSKCDVDHM